MSIQLPNETPFLAHRLEVRRMPLTPPKVDMATKTGIMKAKLPYKRWAKVYTRI